MGNKFKPSKPMNFQRSSKKLEARKPGLAKEKYLVFSLRDLDKTQGQGFEDWEENGLLAKALNRIHGFCRMTLQEALSSGLIKVYGQGLPGNCKFTHPRHVHDDIEWASVKVQGKERIIGFLEDDFIFQVVFLDKDHLFYPSSKKHT